jgi:Putative transposase/Transposase zinc-binding domain
MGSEQCSVRQILHDHGWVALGQMFRCVPRCVWEAAGAALAKMLSCRTPEAGFVRWRCEQCGEVKTVCFTCKSRLCPSCGWLYARQLVERLQGRLIKARYWHMVFSVPSELRELFFWERDLLPTACHAAAAAVMAAYATRCRKYRLIPGIIATCHTFGRNLRFHVHVHLLVTQGGLQEGGVWQPVTYVGARELRLRWQYHLLTRLRQALPRDHPWRERLGGLFREYPTGFIMNLETSYRSLRAALAYCCRYVARPPMGDRRIIAYNGTHVTFEYKHYKTNEMRQERCSGVEFARLLLQHTLPRYARNIHYYGLYQPQARRRWYEQARRVSKYPQNIGGDDGVPLSWRERLIRAFSVDPIQCPTCGAPMTVADLQPPRPPPLKRWEAKRRELLQPTLPFGPAPSVGPGAVPARSAAAPAGRA